MYLLRNSDVICEHPGARAKTEKKKENAGIVALSRQLMTELNHFETLKYTGPLKSSFHSS